MRMAETMTKTPLKTNWIALVVGVFLAFSIPDLAPALAQQKGKIRAQGKELDEKKKKEDESRDLAPEITDPREEMRRFVRSISVTARRLRRGFVVVTQGGLELLEKRDSFDATRAVPASTYGRALDGVIVKSMFHRPPDPSRKTAEYRTDKKQTAELTRLADLGKKRGLQIMVTDFAPTAQIAADSYRMIAERGYVPFTVSGAGYTFNTIPAYPNRPFNENPNTIQGIRQVRNFLYLLDSSSYDRQEDFVMALNGTNFDALIVDVFHRGRVPFTKRNVNGMKFKKLGSRRLVLALMDIGRADSFRYYWKEGWREGSPQFVVSPVAGNPDKFIVRYWDKAWQKIIAGDVNSYLYGIFKQGFDGVVLDGVETYRFFEGATR